MDFYFENYNKVSNYYDYLTDININFFLSPTINSAYANTT